MVHTLKVKDMTRYFNSGIMLMNLKVMREENIESDLMRTLFSIPQSWYVDQDILNAVCCGRVKFFDLNWNCITWWKEANPNTFVESLPPDVYN